MAKICINPGHYSAADPGAVNENTGLTEVGVNLNVGCSLYQILQAAGHELLMVHENDLQMICDAANNFGADVFISIHCNASDNSEAHGTETWCYSGSTAGRHVAEFVQAEMVTLGLTDRGVKEAGYYVLKYTDMPAALVEIAFISNPDEEQLLADSAFQRQAAEAIARGINNYLGGR